MNVTCLLIDYNTTRCIISCIVTTTILGQIDGMAVAKEHNILRSTCSTTLIIYLIENSLIYRHNEK